MSFQHPVNDSLVCGELVGDGCVKMGLFCASIFFMIPFCISVVMDVQDSTHVNCKLFKGLSDALICTDDFIAKVVQRYVYSHL